MKEILGWSAVGLLVSGVWVAIIWAIGKYSPSPWWGLLCLPFFATFPFWGWLDRRMEKYEDHPEGSY